MSDFEIICLANSRKRQGRCVAGIRTDGRGWLRPVGWNPDGFLYANNYWLDNGTEAQVLDVIRLRCIRPHAKPHHPEDWTVAQTQWQLIARPALPEHHALLRKFLVPGPTLFGNTQDKIAAAQFKKFPADSSLALIEPENLQWVVRDNNGKRKTLAQFNLCGIRYSLTLTDPVFEEKLGKLRFGIYARTAAGIPNDATVWLTVSLSEPYRKASAIEEFCYKLVAGVVVLPPFFPSQKAVAVPSATELPTAIPEEPESPDWSWLEAEPPPMPALPEKVEMPEKPVSEHMAALRTVHARNYERWTATEDERLIGLVQSGQSGEEIAALLERSQSVVLSRIGKLVLEKHRHLL